LQRDLKTWPNQGRERTQIYKKFTFDSAHYLPNVPIDHKCRNMHGHTYRMTVYLEGERQPGLDWIIDFAEVSRIVKAVTGIVDHRLLNEIPGLENPTCEVIAAWLWKRIEPELPHLCRIDLAETPDSGVIYEGPRSCS
jgi:6-pyruvoyltetrahydropterin/6-carboxytetrahydropterin synthase